MTKAAGVANYTTIFGQVCDAALPPAAATAYLDKLAETSE